MGMKYENESFDICLDKGVMDAIMCERGDVWKVAPEVAEAVDKMCSEISRILKPGGSYIYITFGQPHFRKPLLELPKYNWNVTVETIGACFDTYFCR
jgi:ubiquinone/menaquinone biosynthesis C-methylase UbiE